MSQLSLKHEIVEVLVLLEDYLGRAKYCLTQHILTIPFSFGIHAKLTSISFFPTPLLIYTICLESIVVAFENKKNLNYCIYNNTCVTNYKNSKLFYCRAMYIHIKNKKWSLIIVKIRTFKN